MSPERIQGKINIDDLEASKRADLWSMGIIIYLLITGRYPFYGETCSDLYD